MELGVVALKAVAGGLGVVLFALVGELVKPKLFAGLFAAAPSVGLASLLVTVVQRGPASASRAALGMVAGAVGLVAFTVVSARLVPRVGALRASLMAIPAWAAVALCLSLALLR